MGRAKAQIMEMEALCTKILKVMIENSFVSVCDIHGEVYTPECYSDEDFNELDCGELLEGLTDEEIENVFSTTMSLVGECCPHCEKHRHE